MNDDTSPKGKKDQIKDHPKYIDDDGDERN